MHTIGVLDSGIGGLTTCYYIFRQIPHVNVIYYADNKNAPYGGKTEGEVYRAVRAGVEYLFSQKCRLIVLACNTATAVAAEELRREFDVPIVGTEPAVKQAENAEGTTLYLATPLTAATKGNDGYLTADTTHLAALIERCAGNNCVMKRLAKIVENSNCDNVVLGCTHYLYLEKYLHNVSVFDGGLGVAKQVARRLPYNPLLGGGRLFLHFSGEEKIVEYLRIFKSYSAY